MKKLNRDKVLNVVCFIGGLVVVACPCTVALYGFYKGDILQRGDEVQYNLDKADALGMIPDTHCKMVFITSQALPAGNAAIVIVSNCKAQTADNSKYAPVSISVVPLESIEKKKICQ